MCNNLVQVPEDVLTALDMVHELVIGKDVFVFIAVTLDSELGVRRMFVNLVVVVSDGLDDGRRL